MRFPKDEEGVVAGERATVPSILVRNEEGLEKPPSPIHDHAPDECLFVGDVCKIKMEPHFAHGDSIIQKRPITRPSSSRA